jgi:A/G-specific adenine glycosylase
MLEVPSTEWTDEPIAAKTALRAAPVRAEWWPVVGVVSHTFTHFRLEMTVYRALVQPDISLNLWAEPDRCRWVHRRNLHAAAVPSAMRKIIAHALKAE